MYLSKKVITKAILDMETMELLSIESYNYFGPWALFGQKSNMRNLVANQATSNAANSATDRSTMTGATGQQQTALGKVGGVASQLLPSVGPGNALNYQPAQMSPYAASTYSANADNIAKTYADQRAQGIKALGSSGFGSSPGANASLLNTSFRNEGEANTGNYRSALNDSLNQMVEGANLESGVAGQQGQIAGQYGSQATNESGLATGQAAQRVGMGSTAGDVLSGISMLASPIIQGFTGVRPPPGSPGAPSPTSYNQNGRNGFANVNRYANTGVGSYSPTPQGAF
jgi:hypothetical protein